MKEEGIPFNTVMERALETKKVMHTPSTINRVRSRADSMESKAPPDTPMAISRSLGESMIRHPTMPAALHPNPIHMVKACLPQAWQLLNGLSRL